MSGLTPGRWVQDGMCVRVEGGDYVAVVRTEEDARAIAALPPMLAALKRARELLADEFSVVVEGSAIVEVDEIIAAAIAEAG